MDRSATENRVAEGPWATALDLSSCRRRLAAEKAPAPPGLHGGSHPVSTERDWRSPPESIEPPTIGSGRQGPESA
jgi:hypothetical protein